MPQGSILGPLLFICFINDLPTVLRHTSPHLYADDNALVSHGPDHVDINYNLTEDATAVADWFQRNHLSCNVGKTKVMKFCNSRYRRKNILLSVNMHNQDIEEIDCFKYLGLHLDSNLNFEQHAQKVTNKVNHAQPPCGVVATSYHLTSQRGYTLVLLNLILSMAVFTTMAAHLRQPNNYKLLKIKQFMLYSLLMVDILQTVCIRKLEFPICKNHTNITPYVLPMGHTQSELRLSQ